MLSVSCVHEDSRCDQLGGTTEYFTRRSIYESYFEYEVNYQFMKLSNNFQFKVAVNTIVPRSPFFLFLYLKTQTVTHIRKNAVEYLRQWNGAICVIYNLCQRQNIR